MQMMDNAAADKDAAMQTMDDNAEDNAAMQTRTPRCRQGPRNADNDATMQAMVRNADNGQ
jgi:hypothetical protein